MQHWIFWFEIWYYEDIVLKKFIKKNIYNHEDKYLQQLYYQWNSLTFRSISVGVSSPLLSLSRLKTSCSWNDLFKLQQSSEKQALNNEDGCYTVKLIILMVIRIHEKCKLKEAYFSSFVSFFFDLTLATVSRTAWSTQREIKLWFSRPSNWNRFFMDLKDEQKVKFSKSLQSYWIWEWITNASKY